MKTLLWMCVAWGCIASVLYVMWPKQPPRNEGASAAWTRMIEDNRDPVTGYMPHVFIRPEDRVQNRPSRLNGLGMNVVACIETAARHQRIASLVDLLDRESYRHGGHYPAKIDSILAEASHRWGQEGDFIYLQFEDPPNIAELLEWCVHTDRVACVSYHGPGKYHTYVNTMVNLVHLDMGWDKKPRACIIDPNWPNEPEWLTRDELLQRITSKEGHTWLIVLTKRPDRDT